MKKRLLYLLPIVLLGLFGAIAWIGLSPDRDPRALPSALVGKPSERLYPGTLQHHQRAHVGGAGGEAATLRLVRENEGGAVNVDQQADALVRHAPALCR